jgi:hypothetical protein
MTAKGYRASTTHLRLLTHNIPLPIQSTLTTLVITDQEQNL